MHVNGRAAGLSLESHVSTAVHWLEQTEGDVPAEHHWLNAEETLVMEGLRFAKRRSDWLLGRWTAKRAVASCLNLPTDDRALADVEIRSAPSGVPEVFFPDQSEGPRISISHRAGTAMCAIAVHGTRIGCDLEMIEPRSDSFIADYFTATEQAQVQQAPEQDRPLLSTLIWSAKESALKALQEGLRLDTYCVEVRFVNPSRNEMEECEGPISLAVAKPARWFALEVLYSQSQVFRGWWSRGDRMVRTVVWSSCGM